MTPRRKISEMVTPDLLRRYLTARGWHAESPSPPPASTPDFSAGALGTTGAFFMNRSTGKRNADVFVLTEPGASNIELIVPRDQAGADFDRRLEGALITLSQVEDHDVQQMIELVRSVGFDLVRSAIPDELVLNDTIHLQRAQNFVRGMRELLAATATTEMRPLAFYGRLSREAVEYSDKCRFGHTYRGSFGFTIESPVAPKKEETLFGFDPAPPFERRVVQRLATGIQQICDAANRDDLDPLRSGFSEGFGANGCERFAALIHATAYSGMSFGFSFSPEWSLPEKLQGSAEFFVGPKHIEVARAAAQALRGELPELPVEIYGAVVRLQNEEDPSDLSAATSEGEISVLYASEDYGDIHVRISLPPAEYLKAVEAHRLGRAIRLKGKLAHKGRYWYLTNPSSLTVTYQPELGL